VVPDGFHVVPVVDYAVFDGVVKSADAGATESAVADVGGVVVHADHDLVVFGPAYNAREDGPGRVLA